MSTSELCVQKEEGHKRIEGSCFSFMHSSCLARLKPQLWNQTIIYQLLIYTTQFIPHTNNQLLIYTTPLSNTQGFDGWLIKTEPQIRWVNIPIQQRQQPVEEKPEVCLTLRTKWHKQPSRMKIPPNFSSIQKLITFKYLIRESVLEYVWLQRWRQCLRCSPLPCQVHACTCFRIAEYTALENAIDRAKHHESLSNTN